MTKYSNVKAEIVNLDKRQNPTIRGLKETFLDIKTQQTESEKKRKKIYHENNHERWRKKTLR